MGTSSGAVQVMCASVALVAVVCARAAVAGGVLLDDGVCSRSVWGSGDGWVFAASCYQLGRCVWPMCLLYC
ncbi:hypothetical protein [Xylella fastidiosa]|uniref:hypothetical protein n=1 Tax=Xylella fastidiosa TaxID=2371 RepID=UPI001386652E|nr:hypothetical protein [Xylella fastidiosa]